jgi:ribosome-binding protein aMBF1 (putative translation factor)
MNDPNSRIPSFITMDRDDGGWTHVGASKKKKVNKAETGPSPIAKCVSFSSQISQSQRIIPKQSSLPTQSMRKLEEADGPIKLKTLSMEMRQEITNRRVSKQWTQADLNKFCSFPQNTIRDIESGRVAPNQHQLSMLNRILKGGIHYN